MDILYCEQWNALQNLKTLRRSVFIRYMVICGSTERRTGGIKKLLISWYLQSRNTLIFLTAPRVSLTTHFSTCFANTHISSMGYRCKMTILGDCSTTQERNVFKHMRRKRRKHEPK